MYDYRTRFSAIDPSPLPENSAELLGVALAEMPGVTGVRSTRHDVADQRVEAEFILRVRHGMADAARDGSRLAKEGLKIAGLPDATLVDLQVTRESPVEG